MRITQSIAVALLVLLVVHGACYARSDRGKYAIDLGVQQVTLNGGPQRQDTVRDWEEPTDGRLADWTVLVYMAADNNLEPDAIDDLNEMEMVGSSADVNIVVQLDRTPGYDSSNGDWTNTRRYYVTYNTDPVNISSTLVENMSEQNMGDGQTLVDFAEWAVSNYPAENYFLVLWDHGDGWRSGRPEGDASRAVCGDDTDGHDYITLCDGELSGALEQITGSLGAKLEIIGFDACLMGMAEVAHVCEPYADVMIGAEPTEPLGGWQYEWWLIDLWNASGDLTPEELANSVVYWYVVSCVGVDDVQAAAVDLNFAGQLADLIDNFAVELLANRSTYATEMGIARASCQDYFCGFAFDHVDLYDYTWFIANSTGGSLSLAAQALMNVWSDLIVSCYYCGVDHQYSNGVAAYYPEGIISFYDPVYGDGLLSQVAHWDEFVSYSPDLIVESVVPSSAAPGTGESITVEITVRNRGYWSSLPSDLHFFFNPSSPPEAGDTGDLATGIPAIAAGTTYVVSTPEITNGVAEEWTSYAYVDCSPYNLEVCETNNRSDAVSIVWTETPVNGFFYAEATATGSVMLRWAVEPCVGLAGIRVYRSTVEDGDPVILADYLNDPTSPSFYEDGDVWPGGRFTYELRAVMSDGLEERVGSPVVIAVPGQLVVQLHAPTPNPASESATVSFDALSNPRSVALSVYDVSGKRVATLIDGDYLSGPQIALWDLRDERGVEVSSGVYLVRLDVGDDRRTTKLLVVR